MNKIISIIVPVYNEVNTVLIVLEKLKNLKLYDDYKPQIITVDDNSNDGTKELLQKLEKNEELKVDTETGQERKVETSMSTSTPPSTQTHSTESNSNTKSVGISFNDFDNVLDMGTNKQESVEAPKTIERLEQISEINNQRRKEEEEDDEDNLEIFDDNNINLDVSDIHDLSKELKIDTPPLLDDIEVLN